MSSTVYFITPNFTYHTIAQIKKELIEFNDYDSQPSIFRTNLVNENILPMLKYFETFVCNYIAKNKQCDLFRARLTFCYINLNASYFMSFNYNDETVYVFIQNKDDKFSLVMYMDLNSNDLNTNPNLDNLKTTLDTEINNILNSEFATLNLPSNPTVVNFIKYLQSGNQCEFKYLF